MLENHVLRQPNQSLVLTSDGFATLQAVAASLVCLLFCLGAQNTK